MYNFLLSEVWWMDTIIGSLIGAFATLIGYFLLYNYNLKTIAKNVETLPQIKADVSKENNNLSREYSDLSKEHSDLSKEHIQLFSMVEKTHDTVGETKQSLNGLVVLMNKEEERNKYREEILKNLNPTRSEIHNALSSLTSLHEVMIHLQEENSALRAENQRLVFKNERLSKQNVKFREHISSKEEASAFNSMNLDEELER